jgi:hypothetical protein
LPGGFTLTLGEATQPGIPGLFGESGWTPPAIGYRRAVDTYQIYDGTDENGIVGARDRCLAHTGSNLGIPPPTKRPSRSNVSRNDVTRLEL